MSDIELPWVERRRSGPPSSCPVCGARTTMLANGVITCWGQGVDHFEWRPDPVHVESERVDGKTCPEAGNVPCSLPDGDRGCCRTSPKPRSEVEAGADKPPYVNSSTTPHYQPEVEGSSELSDEVWVGHYGRVNMEAPPLTADAVAALPDGTPVTVIWTGGNGPHDYVISVDEYGVRCAWIGIEERLRSYNPLRFVGQERFHTRVWLRDEPSAAAPLEGEILGVDYRAAVAGRLTPEAARFAAQHHPLVSPKRGSVNCAGCTSAAVTTNRIVAWPCQTAGLALEMMSLTASDIAITEE